MNMRSVGGLSKSESFMTIQGKLRKGYRSDGCGYMRCVPMQNGGIIGCGHTFCENCLFKCKQFKQSCPLCRNVGTHKTTP
ncbi:unnamed protein product [Caenorhabditis brenneri]